MDLTGNVAFKLKRGDDAIVVFDDLEGEDVRTRMPTLDISECLLLQP